MDLKHIIPQQRRRTYGPSLDIQYSVDRSDVPRVGPTPTFTRASSGTFVNENRRIVGKTTSTTSLNPANVAVGGIAIFAVPSGSVVGWLNNSVVSVMVDSDGNDQIGSEAHVTGTLIHKTDTAITLLVTSKAGTATVSSWFVSYRGQRIAHDPATGKCLGLLNEGARTNLYPRSAGFSEGATWSIIRLVSQPVADTEMSPDGTQSAEKLIPTTENNDHRIDRASTAAVVANTAYSFSVFAKASGYTGFGFGFGSSPTVLVRFSLVGSGSVTFQATGYTAAITPYPDGWYRCTVSFTSPATGTRSYLIVGQDGNTFSYAGDGTSGIILWGAQLEAGTRASSYIPTTAASTTRAEDVSSISGTAFTRFYNPVESTVFFNAKTIENTYNGGYVFLSSDRTICSFGTDFNPSAPRVSSYVVQGPSFAYAANFNFTVSPFVFNKNALAVRQDDFASSVNGSAASTDNSGIFPSLPITSLRIGTNGGQPMFGHVSSLRYHRNRFPTAQLQTLSAIVSETIVFNGVPIWYNGEGLIETS